MSERARPADEHGHPTDEHDRPGDKHGRSTDGDDRPGDKHGRSTDGDDRPADEHRPLPPVRPDRPSLVTLRRLGITAASALPLLPRPPRPAATADGPELTVVAANLERGERDPVGQAEHLVALDADVLLLCEHTAATAAALDDAGLAARWPHRSDAADEGYFGTLVASRLPLVAEERDIGGRPGQVAGIVVDGVPVRLVPVHTQAPLFDRDVAVWHSTIAANAALTADLPGVSVLAGDWNATGGHRPFRRSLARHGLVDASAVLGHRWYPTWPVDKPVHGISLPPVFTLDHVVVSEAVEVVALERIALPGTDHRALRAHLRLPR